MVEVWRVFADDFRGVVADQLFLVENGSFSAVLGEVFFAVAVVEDSASGFQVGVQTDRMWLVGAGERGLLDGRSFDSGFNTCCT